MQLTADYATHDDASSGPLTPGDVGLVVTDDSSAKPFVVASRDGLVWWYTADAVEHATNIVTKENFVANSTVQLALFTLP